ncbi:MAG: glycosyltransferase family 4 protein [Sphaerochaetaceae bacterium]|nr:glycosyltransferase family 4 protein [Sphaerochaetaceae bacterium]
MNIMMIHYKTGGTDGVSLEMDKWKKTFEKMGHRVYYLSGECNNKILHPSLYHITDIAKRFYSYSFEGEHSFTNEKEYKKNVQIEVNKIKPIINSFINDHNIDLIVVQNIWSVAMNVALAIALEEVIENNNVKVLAQHHDFFWERKKGVHYGCDFSKEIANKYIPPTNPRYKHVVINQQGHDTLLKKKNIESTIVPNVFDFEAPLWKKDLYNSDFKSSLGINENDIIILQATRIVNRKAIELAIDVVNKMNLLKDQLIGKQLYNNHKFNNKSNFVLVLAGYDFDDSTQTYLSRLKAHALSLDVDLRVISDRVSHEREIVNNQKIYSLWDCYVYSDLITYPSYWEGWGNQFLEGLFAKVPMIVYEYPVFLTDIKNKGFDYISLGNKYKVNPTTDLVYIEDYILTKAAKSAIEYLFNKEKREISTNKNFEIGKKYFSFDSLYKQLSKILIS